MCVNLLPVKLIFRLAFTIVLPFLADFNQIWKESHFANIKNKFCSDAIGSDLRACA